jgi:hypothetical protein
MEVREIRQDEVKKLLSLDVVIYSFLNQCTNAVFYIVYS